MACNGSMAMVCNGSGARACNGSEQWHVMVQE
jgi:hypothetical protein